MMWGAAILHAIRIRNLVVRQGEEKRPAELMRCIKLKLPISKLSILSSIVFMRKRDRDVSKIQPNALEGKFVGYIDGNNEYVPNTRNVVAVRDVIFEEPEVGSILTTERRPTYLMRGSLQLGIRHPVDGHQDDGNKEEQGTATAKKEEWYDAESVKTQETTLRRDGSDVEEAALDGESTATGSLRDSESLEDSDTEDFSQSETVGFSEEALEQANMAEPRRTTQARNVPQFFGEVRTRLVATEGDYVEPKTVYEAL